MLVFCRDRPKQPFACFGRSIQKRRIRSFGRSFVSYRSLWKTEASANKPKLLVEKVKLRKQKHQNFNCWQGFSACARKFNASASVPFPPKLLRQKLQPNLLPKLPAKRDSADLWFSVTYSYTIRELSHPVILSKLKFGYNTWPLTAHRREALPLRQLREKLLPHPRHEETQAPQSMRITGLPVPLGAVN